jgi:1,4-alpha-glucan branching enzyme
MNLEQFLPAGFTPPGHSKTRQPRVVDSAPEAKVRSFAVPGRFSAKRTRHHVDFFCAAPEAKSVSLVGDFNDWIPTVDPMHRMSDGRWMASLELHHGHHTYFFIVDGKPQLDPKASGIARNSHNEPVSLIAVS